MSITWARFRLDTIGSMAAVSSCVLIVPYFGRVPNYFQLWLNSCARNETIDWVVIGAIDGSYDFPPNVSYRPMAFEELRRRIQRVFDFEISLDHPYKLCDYRPAYAEVFPEVVAGYDYWGHCDLDVIWGRLRHFVTESVLQSHDKIFTGGHLSLYRNVSEVNVAYRSASAGLSVRDVYQTSRVLAFDEWGPSRNGMNAVIPAAGLRIYLDAMPYADVKVKYRALRTNREGFGSRDQQRDERELRKVVYRWEEGVLTQHALRDGSPMKREEAYIHLQKRPMRFELTSSASRAFLIVPPNRFIDDVDRIDRKFLQSRIHDRGIRGQYLRNRVSSAARKVRAALGRGRLRFSARR